MKLVHTGGGKSSFVMVPTPWLSVIAAFTGLPRFTVNVSLASIVVSPFTVTLTGRVGTPGSKVRTPEAGA